VKTVYLHGKLGKRFGKKWELAVDSAQEAYAAIEANNEGFFDYIFNAAKNGTEYIALTKDPKSIKDENDLRENIIDEKLSKVNLKQKEIHVLNPVGGSDPVTIFYAAASFLQGGAIYGVTLKAVLAVAAITAVMQALTKPPKPPERKDPVTTKSFLISGARTRQAQGIAVPVGYGRLKIGATNVATKKTSKKLTTSNKANALESYTEMEFVDLLSEGPIEGFVNKNGSSIADDNIFEGIYLNDVQLKNTPRDASDEGTYNYILNEDQDTSRGKPKFKRGADDESKYLSEGVFSIKEYDTLLYGASPYGRNQKYKQDEKNTEKTRYFVSNATLNDAKIVSHQVSNSSVGKVTFSFRAELSEQQDDGEVVANKLDFAILIVRAEGEYNVSRSDSGCKVLNPGDNQVQEQTNSDGSGNDVNFFRLEGIATSTYQFDIEVEYDTSLNLSEISEGVAFKILKLSPEYDPSVKGGNAGGITRTRRLQLAHVVEEIQENLLYPHSAMVKMLVDSKNFSNVPDRSYHVKLKKVLVPNNYNPITREYDGPWDGLFKGQSGYDESIYSISDTNKQWTDNPAWIFFDLLHNCRYGVGKYGLEEENIDKWQLYKAAKYCDQLVETDYPVETKSGNPRSFSLSANSTSVQIDQGEYLNEDRYRNNANDASPYQTLLGKPSDPTSESQARFIEEFGSGESFKGKKVAFFIHETSGSLSDAERKYKSVARLGKIRIEERTIQSSDPASFTITIDSGIDSANIVGACASQINHAIVEPRFTANLYLTDRAEALEVLKNLASIFRGMVAYSNGKIISLQDSYKNPIQLFNNSNVSPDGFSYMGVHKNKRISASLVRFNNKAKNYQPDLVYQEDADAIQKFGYIENETMGLGITSESQARRFAQWILLTSQLETESITFTAGQEASYLFPGAIFEVSDEMRVGRSRSGRVLGVGTTRNIITDENTYSYANPYVLIDKSILDDPVLSAVELTVCVGATNTTEEKLTLRAPFEKSEKDQDTEIDSIYTPQIYKFEGRMGISDDIQTGPQGQRSIVYDLLVKMPIEINIEENTFESFNHQFNVGDQVVFKSDGVLPGGLIETKVYRIRNATKHTFQVATENNDSSIVFILDQGKDFLLNDGGLHYVCPYNASNAVHAKTQEALDQISIGVPYSIKGVIGVDGVQSTQEELININLGITRDISDIASGWKVSRYFGPFFEKNGWIYALKFSGWIYAKQIIDGASMWFWSEALGWVWIFEKSEDVSYWYVNNTADWIYVKREAQYFFLYNSNTTLSVGSVGQIVNKKYFIQKINTGLGYFIHFTEEANDLSNEYVGDVINDTIDQSESPSFTSASISDVVSVSAEESLQGVNSIRIVFDQGHALDLRRNHQMTIYDFNSSSSTFSNLMQKEWSTIYVNPNVVELIGSETEANETFTFTNGKIRYDASPEFINQRYLEGQLFRVMGVKEISENKYEVSGLEYNNSKFDAVDKKGIIKRPHLPIPPQADMSVPEAPTNLILSNLSF
jgi:predicted phage tail protein